MSDALKRIEERHLPYGDHPGCLEYQQLGDPCDVVKLARALDMIRRYIESSPEEFQKRPGIPQIKREAEHTLEEVASEGGKT